MRAAEAQHLTSPVRQNERVTNPDGPASDRATVTVRRAPKISAFMVVGGLFGFLATLVATSLFPADPSVGFAATLGYLSLFGVTGGVAIGALVAIVLDRQSQRRARTINAEREVVDGAPLEGELEN
jgi:hypothetical protein